VVFGLGGEIKNLGPLPFGGPLKNFFSRNQKMFQENTGEGGRPQKYFQTLGLHNGGLNLVLKTFLDQFSRKFLNI
jgi:hypothetical protein